VGHPAGPHTRAGVFREGTHPLLDDCLNRAARA
jgi:hypothetical protein